MLVICVAALSYFKHPFQSAVQQLPPKVVAFVFLAKRAVLGDDPWTLCAPRYGAARQRVEDKGIEQQL